MKGAQKVSSGRLRIEMMWTYRGKGRSEMLGGCRCKAGERRKEEMGL